MNLSQEEARVLGCLVEKEMTTPDTYPLTLNALVTACNQSSNRYPIVAYDEETVHTAIQGLRAKQLARSVKAPKSRALKHRHDLNVTLRLDEGQRAALAIMLLRGPQTVGELRTRTERYHEFGSLDEVESALGRLAGETPALVQHLERQPGQKEARWTQLLSESELQPSTNAPRPRTPGPGIADLVAAVADLTARVERLESELGIES